MDTSRRQPAEIQNRNLDDWLEDCMKNHHKLFSPTNATDSLNSEHSKRNPKKTMNNHHHMNNNNNNHMLDAHIRPNYSTTVPNYFNNYLNPYTLQKSLTMLQQQTQNQDFASLPPSVNLNHNQSSNSTTVDHQVDGGGFQDLLNVDFNALSGRRFSDPGGVAGNSDDNDSKDDGDDSKKTPNGGNRSQRQTTIDGKTDDKKMMATLLEQINILHETNSKICKNLHETKDTNRGFDKSVIGYYQSKWYEIRLEDNIQLVSLTLRIEIPLSLTSTLPVVELEALKYAPNFGLRHRRDSISGLSTHSQPLNYNLGGTQSPAHTYHSGMYTPGMLTDVVREVREAARIREEALLNRVKILVDERSWNLNENNFRVIREVEELKIQVHKLKTNIKDSNTKMHMMETEIRSLRSLLPSQMQNESRTSFGYVNNSNNESSNNLSNHYNQYNNHPNLPTLANNNNITSSGRSSVQNLNYGVFSHDEGIHLQNLSSTGGGKENGYTPPNKRNSCGIPNGDSNGKSQPGENNHNLSDRSEDRFIGGSSDDHNRSFGSEGQVVQLEKDNLLLRRELQNARATSNESENRIKALEQMLQSLQTNISQINMNNKYSMNHNDANVININEQFSKLKIIENAEQNAIEVLDVTPSANRNVCLTGPVTDL